MRILVVIASYGSQNDAYLELVLAEYRSMPYQARIIVLSNVHKDLGTDIEVIVGLPAKNPWSLPFGHQRIFAEQLTNYDLFIYSEDDILITTKNIEAFLDQSAVLPANRVPGFLRIEKGSDGKIQYCDIHGGAYWDSQSVGSQGEYTFAFFSNEHAACYMLTRQQLQRALDSGKFLVAPHEGKYDMLCTAATDVYTQCGLRKMICISHLETSSVHHLPNKYFNRFGLSEYDLQSQIDALLHLERNGGSYPPLIQMESQLTGCRYARNHYEPPRTEIFPLLPREARSVLSFGCGETEVALSQQGMRVTAVPVDAIVSVTAAEKGVELVVGELKLAIEQLRGRTFDCLLLLNVLHLVRDPEWVVSSLLQFLRKDGSVIALSPYIGGIRFLWGWLAQKEGRKEYRNAGVNITSPGVVKKWLKGAGAVPERLIYVARHAGHSTEVSHLRYLSPIIAREFVLHARKTEAQTLNSTNAHN